MKGFSVFLFLLFMSCDSQLISKKNPVNFEDIYHHHLTLTPEKYLIIDTQPKMKQVYATISKEYGGQRKPPIPQISDEATFLIFKPNLKNSNDVEIVSILVQGQTLEINVKPFNNPDFEKESRFAPNILLKLNQKLNIKNVIINAQN